MGLGQQDHRQLALTAYLHHTISQGNGGLLDEQLHLLLLNAVHFACKGLLLV